MWVVFACSALFIVLVVVVVLVIIHTLNSRPVRIRAYDTPPDDAQKGKIPWILHKTGPLPWYHPKMSPYRSYWKHLSKTNNLEIVYYSDAACRAYIKRHADARVIRAYDTLLPGAFRADLFRYVVLHKEGGIYGDMSQEYLVPMHQLIRPDDDLVLTRDRLTCHRNQIQISFIASVPGHSVMGAVIDYVLDNIEKRVYTHDILGVTGPCAFGTVLEREAHPYRCDLVERGDHIAHRTTGTVAIITKSNRFGVGAHKSVIGKHYSQYWADREVYRD